MGNANSAEEGTGGLGHPNLLSKVTVNGTKKADVDAFLTEGRVDNVQISYNTKRQVRGRCLCCVVFDLFCHILTTYRVFVRVFSDADVCAAGRPLASRWLVTYAVNSLVFCWGYSRAEQKRSIETRCVFLKIVSVDFSNPFANPSSNQQEPPPSFAFGQLMEMLRTHPHALAPRALFCQKHTHTYTHTEHQHHRPTALPHPQMCLVLSRVAHTRSRAFVGYSHVTQ